MNTIDAQKISEAGSGESGPKHASVPVSNENDMLDIRELALILGLLVLAAGGFLVFYWPLVVDVANRTGKLIAP